MKPSSPGENKFGDGNSCGMHGLRFSASPYSDGHLRPRWPPRGVLVANFLHIFLFEFSTLSSEGCSSAFQKKNCKNSEKKLFSAFLGHIGMGSHMATFNFFT